MTTWGGKDEARQPIKHYPPIWDKTWMKNDHRSRQGIHESIFVIYISMIFKVFQWFWMIWCESTRLIYNLHWIPMSLCDLASFSMIRDQSAGFSQSLHGNQWLSMILNGFRWFGGGSAKTNFTYCRGFQGFSMSLDDVWWTNKIYETFA